MRVDGGEWKTLSFDNMEDRPIRGTNDWQKQSIVLDVPENSERISFGVLLDGTGDVWIDDVKLESVSEDVKVTSIDRANYHPQNLNFEISIPSRKLNSTEFR